MARVNVVLALMFCFLFAIFALSNNQMVEINYLYGRVEFSVVLVILGSAALGALVVFILGLVKNIRDKMKLRTLQHKVKDLQDKLQVMVKERDNFLVQAGRMREANTVPGQIDPTGYKEDGTIRVLENDPSKAAGQEEV